MPHSSYAAALSERAVMNAKRKLRRRLRGRICWRKRQDVAGAAGCGRVRSHLADLLQTPDGADQRELLVCPVVHPHDSLRRSSTKCETAAR